jgi:outer membrane protein OmpA-like peptidoglycan-associated protein
MLLPAVALLASACATAHTTATAPAPPSVDVSGRWVGTWRGIGMMDVVRAEPVQAEFVQYGPRGRGHMVWSSTNTAELPDSVSLPGAGGVPVTVEIAGATMLVRHELGGRHLTARLEVDGDEMVGHLVGSQKPVQLRLTREPRRFQTKIEQRVSRVEEDLAGEKERGTRLASELAEARALAEKAGTAAEAATAAAEAATAAAQQAASAAHDAVETANQAMARSGDTASAMTVAVREKPAAAAVTANGTARSEPLHSLDVAFAFDKAELDDAAQTALLEVVDRVRDNPRQMVNLEGYTDSIGTRDYNIRLSQRRVESVHRFLVQKGVGLDQIHIVGLGPLPGEGNAKAQARSRRVTVKLVAE